MVRTLLRHVTVSGRSSSFPVTVACLHSRQGQRLLKTRVDAPAKLLHLVCVLFDEERYATLSKLLQSEVRGGRGLFSISVAAAMSLAQERISAG